MAVDPRVATQRAEARLGSVIKDKWRLDSLLGVGGMACVYAATHRNKKRAAVKMLHPELSVDAALRERFLREGYVANSVGHRGAVSVDDDDVSEDGAAFIVMELLDGESVEQRWQRKGRRLSLEEALAIGDQVLDTLAAAHERGVVHRDLKPDNLFLTREGVVKLLDFGIGRVRELSGARFTTQSGATMGTPAFMAPEQARGRWEDVDGQTDLWAVGATLFTLLTGEHVHVGETVNETLALAVTQPARSIKSLRPDLPARAVAFVDRSLAYAKPQRFPDARSMQVELRLIYAELSGQELSRAAQLSVPDLEPVESSRRAAGQTDPRLRLTTARGVSASDLTARVSVGVLIRKPRVLLIAGAALLGAVLVVSLRLSGGAAPVAKQQMPAAKATAASGRPAAVPVTQAPAAPSVHTPAVSIDALPREKPKKPGPVEPRGVANAPAKKATDPFARRR